MQREERIGFRREREKQFGVSSCEGGNCGAQLMDGLETLGIGNSVGLVPQFAPGS